MSLLSPVLKHFHHDMPSFFIFVLNNKEGEEEEEEEEGRGGFLGSKVDPVLGELLSCVIYCHGGCM